MWCISSVGWDQQIKMFLFQQHFYSFSIFVGVHLFYFSENNIFLANWMNRVQNRSITLLCQVIFYCDWSFEKKKTDTITHQIACMFEHTLSKSIELLFMQLKLYIFRLLQNLNAQKQGLCILSWNLRFIFFYTFYLIYTYIYTVYAHYNNSRFLKQKKKMVGWKWKWILPLIQVLFWEDKQHFFCFAYIICW